MLLPALSSGWGRKRVLISSLAIAEPRSNHDANARQIHVNIASRYTYILSS